MTVWGRELTDEVSGCLGLLATTTLRGQLGIGKLCSSPCIHAAARTWISLGAQMGGLLDALDREGDDGGDTRTAGLGLRHRSSSTGSYRSWIGSGDTTASEQKGLVRHTSIGMTTSYVGTEVESMRPHVNAVAARLMPKR